VPAMVVAAAPVKRECTTERRVSTSIRQTNSPSISRQATGSGGHDLAAIRSSKPLFIGAAGEVDAIAQSAKVELVATVEPLVHYNAKMVIPACGRTTVAPSTAKQSTATCSPPSDPTTLMAASG
jgi:hypothetical protein